MVGLLTAAIPAVAAGIASLWGGHNANEAQKKEAQKSRDFQAAQTATSAQRGVADYKAAGLNPALAYGSPAGNASGAQATITDAVDKAVNSARSYGQAASQLRMQQQQNAMDLEVKNAAIAATHATAHRDTSAALLADRQAELAIQQKTQLNMTNPFLTRQEKVRAFMAEESQQPLLDQMRAQAVLTKLQIPAAKNSATWEEFISGTPSKFLRTAGEGMKFIPHFKFK